MKKFISYLQYYSLAGILLFGNFGVIPTPTSSAELHTEAAAEEGPEDVEPPIYDFASNLIIKAVNPGTSSNVGEFIELYNVTNTPLALAGYQLVYTGSGKPTTVFTFPDGSFLTGKHLLLRLEKPPETDFDLSYKLGNYGMAQDNGKLELFYNEEVVDQVCWTTAKDPGHCIQKTKGSTATIARNLSEDGFELIPADEYEIPIIDPDHPNLDWPSTPELPPDEKDDPPASQCRGLEFSEILPYYAKDKSEQFIELLNTTSEEIILDGCKVMFKNKSYNLTGKVAAGSYYAYHQSDQFALTKNPTNPLTLTLIDTDDTVLDEMAYGKGQKSTTSFAKFINTDGEETWLITYAITPNQENIFQQFRTCEEGKVINEATGNCIKAPVFDDEDEEEAKTSTKTLAECPAGQYRNPLTNRCKKIESTSTTLAECPAGQYRNPLTNRCKKIETASSTLKECAEGYERNPETNRCRKITSSNGNDGADYALTPITKSDKTNFVGLGIVILVIMAGLAYVILQFRREILRAARKTRQRANHICQHLFSRGIRRHRDKQT